MNALPTIESEDESEPENHSLGRVIFNRIGTLERTRLQTRCLQALSVTSVWNQLVFRGGVALHGVYLHGRCSRDLDFLAPAEVQERFVEILAAQGIALQKKEEGRLPFFPMQGTVFKDIAVGIDVCAFRASDANSVSGVFLGADRTKIPVRVLALVPQMAEKLRATSRRARAADFYDVWLFVQKQPDLLPELGHIVRFGEVDDQPNWFDQHESWSHLQELRTSWHEELISLMPKVPSFETVERDWSCLIEQLSTASTF